MLRTGSSTTALTRASCAHKESQGIAVANATRMSTIPTEKNFMAGPPYKGPMGAQGPPYKGLKGRAMGPWDHGAEPMAPGPLVFHPRAHGRWAHGPWAHVPRANKFGFAGFPMRPWESDIWHLLEICSSGSLSIFHLEPCEAQAGSVGMDARYGRSVRTSGTDAR